MESVNLSNTFSKTKGQMDWFLYSVFLLPRSIQSSLSALFIHIFVLNIHHIHTFMDASGEQVGVSILSMDI